MRRGRNLIAMLALALVLAFGLAGCAQDTAGSGGENGGGQIYDSQGNVIDAGSIPPHGEHSEGEGEGEKSSDTDSEGSGEYSEEEGTNEVNRAPAAPTP
ncbi:MAG: hypothetical protein OHK0022_51740 [Roseiflexaceae bacterium]